MNLNEILQTVTSLDHESRMRWLLELVWAMTVSARAGYPLAQQADPVPHLMAFNEMQHQLYNYLRHSPSEGERTIQDFVNGLCQKAKVSGIEGDFGWALRFSVEKLA